jgi:hypothetical protein
MTVDFAITRARAERVAPTNNREGGLWPTFTRASQTVAAAATRLSLLPPPSANMVGRLYHQLAENHAIFMAQKAKCACWRQVDSTSRTVHARAGWQKLAAETSPTKTTLPPAGLSTQGLKWPQGQRAGPQACH